MCERNQERSKLFPQRRRKGGCVSALLRAAHGRYDISAGEKLLGHATFAEPFDHEFLSEGSSVFLIVRAERPQFEGTFSGPCGHVRLLWRSFIWVV